MLENKIKILHIADVHLGRDFNFSSKKVNESQVRKEEIWDSFEKALIFAEDEGVEIVLIPGDLYDNDKMTKSNLDRLAYILAKYQKLRFYISLGNHDHLSPKSDYLKKICSKNVHIFSNTLEFREYKNIRIYGFSWDRVEYQKNPLNLVDLDETYTNILAIHGMDVSISDYMPLDINYLEDLGFDYIALGHIHQPKKAGRLSYYPGSLEPMSFNNLGPHGGLLVELTGKEVKVDFIKMAQRSYYDLDFDVSEISANKDLFKGLMKVFVDIKRTDIIRLNLLGRKSKNLDFEELEAVLKRDYSLIYLVDKTSPKINFQRLLASNKDNIIGRYFDYVFNNFDERDQRQLVKIGLESFDLGDNYED